VLPTEAAASLFALWHLLTEIGTIHAVLQKAFVLQTKNDVLAREGVFSHKGLIYCKFTLMKLLPLAPQTSDWSPDLALALP